MLGPVAAQAFDQAPKHEIAVGLQDHVDEVDDDDAADVAQAQLADDLLRGLEVVLGDGLLEVPARADELAGVDVDDRHGLGAVDHERAAGGQPHLAVQRLLDLLGDAERVERVDVVLVRLDALEQVGRDALQVRPDRALRLLALDEHLREVLVEDVPDDLHEQVGLGVQERRSLLALDLLLDVLPLRGEALHVAGQLLLGGALGRRADDHAGRLRQHLLEDALESRPLVVGELAADAVHRTAGHVHQVAAGQRDLAREAGALVTHGVLGDLDEHAIARLQRQFDATGLVAGLDAVPVDLARVEHGVAAATDVDERGLHAGQHVLHATEVDVADQRGVLVASDVVLHEHAVLQDADLRAAVLGAHDHLAVDGLPACEELGLGHDRTAATGVAAVTTALLLGLEARRALDRLRLGDVLDDPLALPRLVALLVALGAAAATTPPAPSPRLLLVTLRCTVVATGACRKRDDLRRVEVQLRRHLRHEDLGQQTERHGGDGGGLLRLGRGPRLRSGLGLGRGLGLCGSLGLSGRVGLCGSLSRTLRLGRSLGLRGSLRLSRSLGLCGSVGLRRDVLGRGLRRGSVALSLDARSVGGRRQRLRGISRGVESGGVVVIVLIGHLWRAPWHGPLRVP